MKATILHDVDQEVVKKCSEITGLEVLVNEPEDAEIQIVLRRFVPTGKLRMVQTVSAGVDHLKFNELPEGVVLCSNAGAFSDPVAEHAFAMLLSHAKKICHFSSETRNGTYRKERVDTLNGLTLGILGHGGIGRSSARIAKAFGMKVIAFTRTVREDPNVDRFVGSQEDIFRESDILLIALPKTRETIGSVGSRLLSMFRGQVLINVARADIVDEASMKKFLDENPDRYYLSDVWWDEPEVKFPIPMNAMLTPHVGGISRESADQAFIRACTNVRRYLDGNPENIVNVAEYL